MVKKIVLGQTGTADCVPSKQVLYLRGVEEVLRRVLRSASAKPGCRSTAAAAGSKLLCTLGLAGRPETPL